MLCTKIMSQVHSIQLLDVETVKAPHLRSRALTFGAAERCKKA